MSANQQQDQENGREKNGEITLAGYFQASSTSFSPSPRLLDIPADYKIIDVAAAVLKEHALLEFESNPLCINIPMVKEVRTEKNITIMLSIGGHNGNFPYLTGSDKVTNFYNSLVELYQNWEFDGVNFDIRRLDNDNRDYLIKAVRWFHETFPGAILSITVQATGVSPAFEGIYGEWNRAVPLINELKDCIDRIQIMAYEYGPAFEEIEKSQSTPPSTSPPTSTPTPGMNQPVPLNEPQGMLEYIFSSYVEPFTFSNRGENFENTGVTGYDGFDVDRLMLVVTPVPGSDPRYYVDPDGIKGALKNIQDRYNETPAGIMIATINDDANNGFGFSKQFTAGQGN